MRLISYKDVGALVSILFLVRLLLHVDDFLRLLSIFPCHLFLLALLILVGHG